MRFMADGETLACAMCGRAIADSAGAIEAKGRWFCSREHRLAFEGGRTAAASRRNRRISLFAAAVIPFAIVLAIVIAQAHSPSRPKAVGVLGIPIQPQTIVYKATLDAAALRTADLYMRAKYVALRCPVPSTLFDHVLTVGTPCKETVDAARKYHTFLVDGSRRVQHDCRNDMVMINDFGVTVRAKECVVYTTVGRTNLLERVNGKSVVSYPLTEIALFLAREDSGWRVALEDTWKTSSGPGTPPPQWAHRVPHASRVRLS
jgi:hypothetical protein